MRAYGGQKFSSGMLAGILSDHRFQLARSRNKSVRILFSVSFSELRWRQSHGLSLWRPFPGFFDQHSGGILPRCLGCLLLSRPDTHTHTHPHKIKIQHFLYDQSEKPKKKKGLEKLSAMLRDSPERFPAILRLPTVLLSQPYNGYAGSILIRWGSYNLAAPIEADAGDDPATT